MKMICALEGASYFMGGVRKNTVVHKSGSKMLKRGPKKPKAVVKPYFRFQNSFSDANSIKPQKHFCYEHTCFGCLTGLANCLHDVEVDLGSGQPLIPAQSPQVLSQSPVNLVRDAGKFISVLLTRKEIPKIEKSKR